MLAAGAGTRLRPLTLLRPKPLCPLGDRPLIDHALARFEDAPLVDGSIAVNVHHGRDLMESHLTGRVHVSFEDDAPLGTAGALGKLHDWIAGRPTLVVNGDTWCPSGLQDLVEGWDGERIRILTPDSGPLSPRTRIAGALMPWSDVRQLAAVPSGLYETSWRAAVAQQRVETVTLNPDVPFADCGTPVEYLAANMVWSGGESVIGAGAKVEGTVERSVIWPGARVLSVEHLVGAIRAGNLTVLARP